MRADSYQYQKYLDKIQTDVGSVGEAERVIYGWVKQDLINPAQMAQLILIAYEKFKISN